MTLITNKITFIKSSEIAMAACVISQQLEGCIFSFNAWWVCSVLPLKSFILCFLRNKNGVFWYNQAAIDAGNLFELKQVFKAYPLYISSITGIECEPCEGRGWLLCDYCKGQKTNVKSETNRIYRRCPSCRAVGYVLCSKCKVFKCVTYPDQSDCEM